MPMNGFIAAIVLQNIVKYFANFFLEVSFYFLKPDSYQRDLRRSGFLMEEFLFYSFLPRKEPKALMLVNGR